MAVDATAPPAIAGMEAFSDEQKQYLQGFAAGSGLARSLACLPVLNGNGAGATFAATLGLPAAAGETPDASTGAERIHAEARRAFEAAGGKLCNEEIAKRKKNPLDLWDEIAAHAESASFPKGTDVFLFKFNGLFYVAPAQDSFMCRLRFPGGIVSAAQMRAVAALAEQYGGGYADITTRANLQIRQIKPGDTMHVLYGLQEAGIVNRGAGADNIRNITASPTAGIDPSELIDTRPLARRLNDYILNHRELYGLPRKFNIAFTAVRVRGSANVAEGVYFRLALAGITGHRDFARPTEILVAPGETIEVAAAIVRAFIEHGDRGDRKKARLKYVIDRLGVEPFLAEAQKHLPPARAQWRRVPEAQIEPRPAVDPLGHIGVHRQKQPGLHYVGVSVPVGRLGVREMRGLAAIADRFGSGTLRLTVWQNLLISDIAEEDVATVRGELADLGLSCSASGFRAALVACTGNTGCKFANIDTKRHALAIAAHLEARLEIDRPINIHVTGCPHSCAQHFIGDIGLLGTKTARGEEMIEAMHVFVGGGYGADQSIGREIYRDVTYDQAPRVIERMVRAYLEGRSGPEESFGQFVRRHETAELLARFESVAV